VPDHPFLFYVAQRYVDRFLGEGSDNIRSNGEWRCIQHFIPHARVVFDVGANVGEWASLVRSINSDCEIHCFEPSRHTFKKLIERRLPGKVVLNNFGLSSTPGRANLAIYPESGQNSIHFSTSQNLGTVQIELQTMDNYIENSGVAQVDYCKIDVEGHELAVLRGMSSLLKEGRVKIIQFEYGATYRRAGVFLQDAFSCFTGLPYALFKITRCGLIAVPSYSERLETFRYSNWLAVHQDWKERADHLVRFKL
jgi:FkbM family methyltransferase